MAAQALHRVAWICYHDRPDFRRSVVASKRQKRQRNMSPCALRVADLGEHWRFRMKLFRFDRVRAGHIWRFLPVTVTV